MNHRRSNAILRLVLTRRTFMNAAGWSIGSATIWGCGIRNRNRIASSTMDSAQPATEETLQQAASWLNQNGNVAWAGVSQRRIQRYFVDVMQSGCDESIVRAIALGVTSADGDHSVHCADDMTQLQILQAAQHLGAGNHSTQNVFAQSKKQSPTTAVWASDEARWRSAVQAAHQSFSTEVSSRVVFHGVSATVIEDKHWQVVSGIASTHSVVRVLWQAVIASREQQRIDVVTTSLGNVAAPQQPIASPFTETHRQQMLTALLRRPTLTVAPTAVTGILIDQALTAALAYAVSATGYPWPAMSVADSLPAPAANEFGTSMIGNHPLQEIIVTAAQHLLVDATRLPPAPNTMPPVTFRLEGGHVTLDNNGVAKLFPAWCIELANGQPTGRSYRDRCIAVRLADIYAMNTSTEPAEPASPQCWFIDGIATSVVAPPLLTTGTLVSIVAVRKSS
jgi:hypothetical protein